MVLEEGKISSRQAIFLMVSTVLSTAFLFVSSGTAYLAGQDGWISILLATLVALLASWLAVSLGLRFPDKTLFQFSEIILGRWPGKVVALLFILWYVYFADALRQYGSFLVDAFMPDTPLIVFELVFMAIAAYAVRNGLEVFNRINEIILPLILGSLIVLYILAGPQMDLKRLLPVFIERGAVPVIKGAVMPAAWMGEIVTMAMLIPYLNKAKEAHKVAVTATLINGFFILVSFVAGIAVFGPKISAGWFFPGLNVAMMIHLANFIERFEAVIMAVWVAGALVKISLFYWVVVLGSAQLLELKDYRPLVLPVGVIFLALSIMLHDSVMDLFVFVSTYWSVLALTVFELGLPLLLLVVAVIRGQGGSRY